MWNYRSKIKYMTVFLFFLMSIYFFGGEVCVEAESVYSCDSEAELKKAIEYSNQHPDIWITIQVKDFISLRQTYDIKGKVRLQSDTQKLEMIRRKNCSGHLFRVFGRLQLGKISDGSKIAIDGASRQGEYGDALIAVMDGGTFDMYQGSQIQYNYNRKTSEDNLPRGAGVLVNVGGTFTMYDGLIQYCWSKNTKVLGIETNAGSGGGVHVDSTSTSRYGSFVMKDGQIKNCASQQGGGVFSLGYFEMTGGDICKNHASLGSYQEGGASVSYSNCNSNTGGAVKLQAYANPDAHKSYAKTVIHGGTLCHNDAYNGGAIRITNGAELTIKGLTISNNFAANRGGGIDIGRGIYESRSLTKVTIEAVHINSCRTDGNGGAMAIADGRCQVSQMTTAGNQAEKYGNGLYLSESGKFYMQDKAKFQEDDHVYLTEGAYIRIAGGLTSEGSAATIRMAEREYRLGRKVASVTYQKNGSGGLYGNPKTFEEDKFLLYKNKNGYQLFRPGDRLNLSKLQKETDMTLERRDIFISESYDICYYANREDKVENLPETGKKYWYEDTNISDRIPTAEHTKFKYWCTKKNPTKEDTCFHPGYSYTINQTQKLYAIWDIPANFVWKDQVRFYENQKVGKKELLTMIQAIKDEEDGTIEDPDWISQHVVIKQISYEQAKDGYQPKNQIFFKDIGEEKMDTYFGHLEKEECVKAFVRFLVTDLAGNETIGEREVTIVYNHPPQIKADALSFFDHEIEKSWPDVVKEIKNNPVVTDQEDKEFGLEMPKVNIKKPESFNQEDFRIPGMYHITYETKDSLGKITEYTIPVFVANSDPYADTVYKYIRFIDKRYLSTLNGNSPWKQNVEQFQMLQKSVSTDSVNGKKTILITIVKENDVN